MPPSKSKYDPFFSRSMEQLPIAQAFFSQHLPQHIRQLVDLDSFVHLDRTNTNQKLEQRRRDIAYEAPMEGEIALLACAEQQSQPDIMMPVRLFYYGAGDLYAYLKEYKKIPIVIQVLFYNVRHEVAHSKCMPRHTGVTSTPHCHTLGARRVIP